MAIAARLASGPQMDKAAREQAELLTSSTPASSALAAALGANPAELKHDWHLVGPELTREEFAYLVSRHLGQHAELSQRPQNELLTGTAELYEEATVLQGDKTRISWTAFSQALVAATLAAGPPPRLASDARLVRARVIVDGSNLISKAKPKAAVFSKKRPAEGGLVISPDLEIHFLPKPVSRFLVCEENADSPDYRLSLWTMSGGAGEQTSTHLLSCLNVLQERGPLPTSVALVPTLRYPTRETSIGAITTGDCTSDCMPIAMDCDF